MSESAPESAGEGFVAQSHGPEQQHISAGDKRVAAIVFPSFRLSQGNPESKSLDNSSFQKNLFLYLHAVNPSWRIDNPDDVRALAADKIKNMFFPGGPDKKRKHPPGEALAKIADRITRIVAPVKIDGKRYPRRTPLGTHADVRTKDVEYQFDKSVRDFTEILNPPIDSTAAPEGLTQEQLLPVLVDNFVSTDAFYFAQEGGRKRAHPDSNNFRDDPFSSYTLEFVMRGRPTGAAEFNEMCGALRTYILQQIARPTTDWTNKTAPLFDSVIDRYNENHSLEQQYTLPTPEEASEALKTTPEATLEMLTEEGKQE